MAGSYFSFNHYMETESSREIFMRTVRGARVKRDLFRLVRLDCDLDRPATFSPGGDLFIPTSTSDQGVIVTYQSPTVIRIATDSPIRLEGQLQGDYDCLNRLSDTSWSFVKFSSGTTMLVTVLSGAVNVDAVWLGERHSPIDFQLSAGAMVEIEERIDQPAFMASERESTLGFALPTYHQFASKFGTTDAQYTRAQKVACYVIWSSFVDPSGLWSRPVVYMSKVRMTGVWSWDHCFNAMALGPWPELAWHQLASMFDLQSQLGNLPDAQNDCTVSYSFVKPPVHGWTANWGHSRGLFRDSQIAQLLPKLERWTRFWLDERIRPGRRLPCYYHGNDSGWDNSTVFDTGVPVESPDIAAHLIGQLDSMASMARRIGQSGRGKLYQKQADELFKTLLSDEFWLGDRFVARNTSTGKMIDTQSLLLLQPLMLGARLPKSILDILVNRLVTGDFITQYGLATESTSSPKYEPDGYWRGPVWAPSTLLIVDGLYRAGKSELAVDIAKRYCNAFVKSGAAENYDALTGEGNREKSFTWSASVFLVFLTYLR